MGGTSSRVHLDAAINEGAEVWVRWIAMARAIDGAEVPEDHALRGIQCVLDLDDARRRDLVARQVADLDVNAAWTLRG